MSEFMQDYSEAVFSEGDCPIDYVDLSVLVVPPPPEGRGLLRRVTRDHAAERQAAIKQWTEALDDPAALARLLGAGLGEPLQAMVSSRPRIFDDLRRSMKSKLKQIRRSPAPVPTKHWALEEGYAGIEHAQLVVANVRRESERSAAAALVGEVERLRKNDAVFRDVMDGVRGNRSPITAVVADLSNPKDSGLKKAIARVKRATKRVLQ